MFVTIYLIVAATIACVSMVFKIFTNIRSDVLDGIAEGALIGFILCVITGMNVIIKKADFEKMNAVENDNNCWVINGNRICGAYSFEDDQTKIEVTEDGKTHITIK